MKNSIIYLCLFFICCNSSIGAQNCTEAINELEKKVKDAVQEKNKALRERASALEKIEQTKRDYDALKANGGIDIKSIADAFEINIAHERKVKDSVEQNLYYQTDQLIQKSKELDKVQEKLKITAEQLEDKRTIVKALEKDTLRFAQALLDSQNANKGLRYDLALLEKSNLEKDNSIKDLIFTKDSLLIRQDGLRQQIKRQNMRADSVFFRYHYFDFVDNRLYFDAKKHKFEDVVFELAIEEDKGKFFHLKSLPEDKEKLQKVLKLLMKHKDKVKIYLDIDMKGDTDGKAIGLANVAYQEVVKSFASEGLINDAVNKDDNLVMSLNNYFKFKPSSSNKNRIQVGFALIDKK